MTPIGIIALIIIIISAIKIIVILVNPKSWADVVKKLCSNPMVTSIVSLILSAIVLYYLIQSGLTIVQILAVTLFVALLMAVGIGMYAKEVISMSTRLLKKGVLKKAWFYTLIWIILLIWGAKELFM